MTEEEIKYAVTQELIAYTPPGYDGDEVASAVSYVMALMFNLPHSEQELFARLVSAYCGGIYHEIRVAKLRKRQQ